MFAQNRTWKDNLSQLPTHCDAPVDKKANPTASPDGVHLCCAELRAGMVAMVQASNTVWRAAGTHARKLMLSTSTRLQAGAVV